jgi:hypothetical protein|tara:strand:+ start:629 stop:880 length:252 start_codon:yes stop_codon:yes gene_type:complete
MSDKTKDEYVVQFIKSLKAVEDEMEPYKEHKRDLRKNYIDNSWLTRDEIRNAIRAYRMVSKDEDFDQLHLIYDKIVKSLRGAK